MLDLSEIRRSRVTDGRHVMGVRAAVLPTIAVIRDASLASPPDHIWGHESGQGAPAG
jgi:hypothetical protein